ncbi:MAG: hypothetical protein R3B95_16055 [Nitrospirales bacterium]|nr:hypothetical protein [Nitrospirales bacterium]
MGRLCQDPRRDYANRLPRIAKHAGNGISIDGEEAKAETVFGVVQFKRLEPAFGLKVSGLSVCRVGVRHE